MSVYIHQCHEKGPLLLFQWTENVLKYFTHEITSKTFWKSCKAVTDNILIRQIIYVPESAMKILLLSTGGFQLFQTRFKNVVQAPKNRVRHLLEFWKASSTSDAWLGENWLQLLSTQNQQPAFPTQWSNNSHSILLKSYTKTVIACKVNIHFQNNTLTSTKCSKHTKHIWTAPATNCTSPHLQACPVHNAGKCISSLLCLLDKSWSQHSQSI